MIIEILKSKIHRVKVTQAELNYVGSITIDEDLMDAAQIIANEKVQIVNNNNGERFETYVIKGERGTGTICLNGATARKVQVGDILIIMSYGSLPIAEAKAYHPILVFPDDNNHLLK
ncbi:aspartate 1-decarboxylase [Pedobacter metabolipauper]|uniref:Aspartate 1-decarboxylase n=1 Tax=Pedobacter metabolipauper TaxID=425513 RepID=A0A4R6SW96_9SPHI|nr:aspartate 1-decarboxylase [Pedobacter metabolipauper]TDQ09373.1 L-aspartate 1-decarboxylase [Pedobacter metabolipauper]